VPTMNERHSDRGPQSEAAKRLHAQLNRTRLSSDDFDECSRYLTTLQECSGEWLQRGLLTAAIVTYARPFTNNNPRRIPDVTGSLSVSINQVLSLEEKKLHDQLIALRNEVVAHTDYSRKPVRRLEGALNGFSMNPTVFDLLGEQIDLKVFSGICMTFKAHCFSTLLELNEKIVAEEAGGIAT
jgi:hypothetical protein